jgi:hypothetical protein
MIVSLAGKIWNARRGHRIPRLDLEDVDCKTGPALIADHDGTPTAFGVGVKDRLTRLP